MIIFIALILAGPKVDMVIPAIITVSCVVSVIAAIILVVCIVRKCRVKPREPVLQKKRVVVMRPNILYADSYKDPNSKGSTTPLVPQVRIEGGRKRLSSELTAMYEYDIQLDKEWEFSRER